MNTGSLAFYRGSTKQISLFLGFRFLDLFQVVEIWFQPQNRSFHISLRLILTFSFVIWRMAGGGNFIHRVLSYVANELIVNGLANK